MGRGPRIAEGRRVAHALDRKALAEGVETEEQAKILRLLKCNEMQGYFSASRSPQITSKFSVVS
jgi:EAL domain-containing protein (putative c-di-GMP-specific phosphodiesterase class I)